MHVMLNICDLLIDFDTRYPDYVRERCAGYVVEWGIGREPDVCVRATDADIERANVEQVGLMEAELYAMTIPLSERMPLIDRMMTHGVAITFEGRSYMFTAESGVGKSTHAFLWQKFLGEDRVRVINGDKPILRFCDDGSVLAYGSPWSGKEHLDENVSAPLGGICLLRRLDDEAAGDDPDVAPGPRAYRASRQEALDFLLNQVFIPQDASAKLKTLELLDRLYDAVPIYHLVTDMSSAGVEAAFSALVHWSGTGRPCLYELF